MSVTTKSYKLILTTDGEVEVQNTPEMAEFVRRLSACVHACEGITTEELERGIIQDMQRVINEMVPLIQDHKSLLETVNKQARAA
jgi:thiamine phosphate synthase YjbQ (UPF0047 family)